ncbi:hypothetical protein pEaSNUABM29_00239 [Erwinia phage pEa_SNUABM_29]|nr:hypothetical protein pEaSNUABM29_00239 [Erwinia phage pEa_SNUABM_29]
MADIGYQTDGKELMKLVPNNQAYLKLKGGFVEMPRTWNRKKAIHICVRMACGYPAYPLTEPEYLHPGSEVTSPFREIMYKRIAQQIEEICHSEWACLVEKNVDVTRTDRRGRYLPRPV